MSGTASPPTPPAGQLGSAEARRLAERIEGTSSRYRVRSIRLLSGGGCGVVVVDPATGVEHVLDTAPAWDRLLLAGADTDTA